MLFNEEQFKSIITQAVAEAVPRERKYERFANVKEFSQISGISEGDIRSKLLHNEAFKSALYKFDDDSRKYYIDINKGIQLLKVIMKRGY